MGWTYALLAKRTDEARTALLDEHDPSWLDDSESSLESAPEVAAEQTYISDMVHSLALPWDALFAGIESAAGDDVALLSLQADPEKLGVRISGEARGLSDMFAYLQCIEDQGILKNSYLGSYQIQMNDATQPVRFEVSARWLRRPVGEAGVANNTVELCWQAS